MELPLPVEKAGKLRVNGHQDLPTGGHWDSPGTDTAIPQGRPTGRPTDGHGNSPPTANMGRPEASAERHHPLAGGGVG